MPLSHTKHAIWTEAQITNGWIWLQQPIVLQKRPSHCFVTLTRLAGFHSLAQFCWWRHWSIVTAARYCSSRSRKPAPRLLAVWELPRQFCCKARWCLHGPEPDFLWGTWSQIFQAVVKNHAINVYLLNIGIRSMRQRSSVITAGSLGMFCRDKQCTQWRSQPPIFFGGAKCVILGEQ